MKREKKKFDKSTGAKNILKTLTPRELELLPSFPPSFLPSSFSSAFSYLLPPEGGHRLYSSPLLRFSIPISECNDIVEDASHSL
jgi:hypothetical protein